jgi:hypothetical protein
VGVAGVEHTRRPKPLERPWYLKQTVGEQEEEEKRTGRPKDGGTRAAAASFKLRVPTGECKEEVES